MHVSYFFVFPVIFFFLSGVNAINDLTSRAFLDVCADVNTNVLRIPVAVGTIHACICISALPLFIQTDPVAKAAVLLFGQAKVIAALSALINAAPGSTHCSFPDHAIPACQPNNPCFFTCSNGFTAAPPNACVCVSPNVVCDGTCGYFPSCSSGHARRAVSGPDVRARDSNCQGGSTACPVPGRGRSAWECIDTMSDLESCGGCIFPGVIGPTGVDCTSIEGVADVDCHKGQCVVHRCMPGYAVDDYGSQCVSNDRSVLDASEILAAEFGFEHVPF
jgi:hypothetical protein